MQHIDGISFLASSVEWFKMMSKCRLLIWFERCVMNPRSFWEDGFDWAKNSCDWIILEVKNQLVGNAGPERLKCSISPFITNTLFSWMGDSNLKSHQEMICAHENVIALIFIIPAEKNFEQQMSTENNKQDGDTKETCGDLQDDRGTKWIEEIGTRQSRPSKGYI